MPGESWPWCCKSASAAMLVFCPRSTCKVNVSHKILIFAIIKMKNLMSLIFEQTWPRMSHRHKTLLAGKSSLPIQMAIYLVITHIPIHLYFFSILSIFFFLFKSKEPQRSYLKPHEWRRKAAAPTSTLCSCQSVRNLLSLREMELVGLVVIDGRMDRREDAEKDVWSLWWLPEGAIKFISEVCCA